MNALTRDDLVHFTGNLQYRLKLLAQTRQHTDRLLATRFNIFHYLRPDENLLSDIIRDLLDAKGNHGQGEAFLKEFLETMCSSPISNWQFRSVERENATSLIDNTQRRMDVLLDLGNFGVAIENKPWAGEQKDQIHDYVTHLERRFAGNFVIVYLSSNGGKPASISQAVTKRLLQEKKLILAAYRGRFREWLERCYRICAAEKLRWFLYDFMAYAEQTFSADEETIPELDYE
jgi:hypothetical protein